MYFQFLVQAQLWQKLLSLKAGKRQRGKGSCVSICFSACLLSLLQSRLQKTVQSAIDAKLIYVLTNCCWGEDSNRAYLQMKLLSYTR